MSEDDKDDRKLKGMRDILREAAEMVKSSGREPPEEVRGWLELLPEIEELIELRARNDRREAALTARRAELEATLSEMLASKEPRGQA